MAHLHSRRTLLKAAALAPVGYWLGTQVQPANADAPQEKLNLAIIGQEGNIQIDPRN